METKRKICIDNSTYEDCLTIGKEYDIKTELLPNNERMYHLIDDKGEPLQTMINRFKDQNNIK